MTRAGLQALLSHWWRHPLQLFTLLSGIALATALWSGVQAINTEARASYDAAARTLAQGQFDRLVPARGGLIAQEDYIGLRRAGWLVSPVLDGRLRIGEGSVRVVGIDPLTAPSGLAPPLETGEVDLAAFVTGASLALAAPETARALSGLQIEIITARDLAPGTLLTDIGQAQRLLEAPDQLSRLVVAPGQPLGQKPLEEIAPGLRREPAQDATDVGRLTDSFHLNLTAFGLLSFAVGIFIVYATIGLALEQRRAMFRTLRATGLPLRRLILLLAGELTLFALLAGATGVALGYGIAAALLPDVAATLRGLYDADVAGTLTFRPGWWLSSLAIALFGTALAACGWIWKVAQLPILASAQPRAWAVTSARTARRMGAAAALLLATAFGLTLFGSGLVAGFALLACLLIGAALALPVILGAILAFAAGRARAPRAQWFWADTRQQVPGLSMALMALLLAMSANIGVSTMVSSFRLTFTDWLDQRLASEVYVTAASARDANDIRAWLLPRSVAVLPIVSVPARIGGAPAEIFAVADHATYRDHWPLLAAGPQVWNRLAAGEGALINEQLARRMDLRPGDVLETGDNVLGIYSDYGNPTGQVILGFGLFRSRFPEAEIRRFGIRVAPDKAGKLAAELREAFGPAATSVVNQATIKRFSLDVFERTFTVTTALNVLTLSVAGFAMLMSLLTLATMRLPQLAPVWALGITRRGLARLELLRALCLAALVSILALPLGLALAWVLLAVVNVEAFGWRLPMFLFPADYLRLGILALLAAAVAALWPAIRLARTPAAELLKVFSNER